LRGAFNPDFDFQIHEFGGLSTFDRSEQTNVRINPHMHLNRRVVAANLRLCDPPETAVTSRVLDFNLLNLPTVLERVSWIIELIYISSGAIGQNPTV
jgi:hypothetical protein